MKAITPHYIDGKFVEPHGREVMDSINPTNNNVIGSVTLADEEDAKRAIAAAKRAFASFGGTSKEERAAVLRRMQKVVTARIHDLTAAMVEEYGGVHHFSKLIVQMAADSFFHAEKALQELPLVRTWNKTTVYLTPVGVAGLITAWNSNALFVCLKTASALAAGCTVVVKPSELRSFQTQVLLECVHEANLPRGVFNVVTGLGSTVGAELVRNPDVAKISFTGSVAVGQQIMRDGAATMKRVTLELGGKSPNILLDDVNLDEAIPRALAIAFLNSGQACAAGTLHSALLVAQSTTQGLLVALGKTAALAGQVAAARKTAERDREREERGNTSGMLWPGLGGILDEARHRLGEEREARSRQTRARADELGRELRYHQQVVASELAGWQDLHARLGRESVVGFARAALIEERNRLDGFRRALRRLREGV